MDKKQITTTTTKTATTTSKTIYKGTGPLKASEGSRPTKQGAQAMQSTSTSRSAVTNSGKPRPMVKPGQALAKTKESGGGVAQRSPPRETPGTSGRQPGMQIAAGDKAESGAQAPGGPPATPTAFTRPDQRPEPAAAGYRQRKLAARILQRFTATPDLCSKAKEEHVKEILTEIDWAKAVLPDYRKPEEKQPQAPSSKRNRSGENTPNQYAKRVRTQGPSFAEVAKEQILLGVIDESNEDSLTLRQQWKWVKAAMADIAINIMLENPGPPPTCKGAGWFQNNIRVIACEDARSAEIYKKTVAGIGEVYPGAKLRAVDFKDLPVRPRARAWLPCRPAEPERILQTIRLYNPELPTDNWKVVKINESGKATMQVVLLLNKDSIELLEQKSGVIRYGCDMAKIKVYSNDVNAAKNLIAEVEPEEANSDVEMEEESEQVDPMDDLTGGYASSTSSLGVGRMLRLYTEEELIEMSEDAVNSTLIGDVGDNGQDGEGTAD
ncbi:PREDICTED: uncharacterized protein LOC108367283 [Rhagoletis zephyria]|uniref:uncharacterized protein LOC108367283 n=1 Tax=Rhagoletis zephyria TaxID=28612 RepID=UPI0008113412|nr:PREDICTED: uncharacterized protein LOC108367283 [Rhagoletis zephyria]